jgi:hypothetical protein
MTRFSTEPSGRAGSTIAKLANRATALLVVALFITWHVSARANESSEDLFEQGYRVVYKSGYTTITECTPDKPVVIDGIYISICQGYGYVYHYGPVFIASRSFEYQGKTLSNTYLCLKGKNECLSGQLYRK